LREGGLRCTIEGHKEGQMAEKLVKYRPELAFVAEVEEGEDFDPAEYFLDAMHTWVMETDPDEVRGNIVVIDQTQWDAIGD
jgi:hypothetical protein